MSLPSTLTIAVQLLDINNLNIPFWEKVGCNFHFQVCEFISWSGVIEIVVSALIILFAIFFLWMLF